MNNNLNKFTKISYILLSGGILFSCRDNLVLKPVSAMLNKSDYLSEEWDNLGSNEEMIYENKDKSIKPKIRAKVAKENQYDDFYKKEEGRETVKQEFPPHCKFKPLWTDSEIFSKEVRKDGSKNLSSDSYNSATYNDEINTSTNGCIAKKGSHSSTFKAKKKKQEKEDFILSEKDKESKGEIKLNNKDFEKCPNSKAPDICKNLLKSESKNFEKKKILPKEEKTLLTKGVPKTSIDNFLSNFGFIGSSITGISSLIMILKKKKESIKFK